MRKWVGITRGDWRVVDRTYGHWDGSERWRRALEAVGGFRSDRSDVSDRHDDALADAFDHAHVRNIGP